MLKIREHSKNKGLYKLILAHLSLFSSNPDCCKTNQLETVFTNLLMTEKPVKIVDSQTPSLKTEVQCSCHSDQPLQEGEPHERSYLILGINDLLKGLKQRDNYDILNIEH